MSKAQRTRPSSPGHTEGEFDIVVGAEPVGWRAYFKELYNYRELMVNLAQRDFLVRFKHTSAGLAWIFFKPLMLMLVLSFVFGRVSGLSKDVGIPYPLLVLSALIPWQFFASSLSEVTNSLVWNQHILTKTYFPRMLLPFGSLFANFVDFFVAFLLLAVVFVIYGYCPGWQAFLLPLFVLLLLGFILGLGLWTSVLNARFRDIQQMLPFMLQLGMYVSPVGYRFDTVPVKWQFLYNMNPLVGILEGFRWCLLRGEGGLHVSALLMSTAMSVVLILSGFYFFRRSERDLADVI
jgi:lipopolysaccharide transport system permease protein